MTTTERTCALLSFLIDQIEDLIDFLRFEVFGVDNALRDAQEAVDAAAAAATEQKLASWGELLFRGVST